MYRSKHWDIITESLNERVDRFNNEKPVQTNFLFDLSKDFKKKFKVSEPAKDFLVNSFQQVNSPDPYET
jgi:hypothetical protein